MTRLETDRLIVRTLEDADAEAYHAIACEPEMMKWHHVEEAPTLEGIREKIAYRRELEGRHGFAIFAVEEKATGHLVGLAGLGFAKRTGDDSEEEYPELIENAEIVYSISTPRWGNGFATESSRACIAHGFEECGLDTIWGMTMPDNVRSQRVMAKLGMEPLGLGRRFFEHELQLFRANRKTWQGRSI